MEISKQLGPFKIHISVDGLKKEDEQYILHIIKDELKDMKYLGFPWSDGRYRTTYKHPRNNIGKYLSSMMTLLYIRNMQLRAKKS